MNVQVAFAVVKDAGWDVKLERFRKVNVFGTFQAIVLRSPRCFHCDGHHTIAGVLAPGAGGLDLQRMASAMRNQFQQHLKDGCRH